jgi:hypothetical protein
MFLHADVINADVINTVTGNHTGHTGHHIDNKLWIIIGVSSAAGIIFMTTMITIAIMGVCLCKLKRRARGYHRQRDAEGEDAEGEGAEVRGP